MKKILLAGLLFTNLMAVAQESNTTTDLKGTVNYLSLYPELAGNGFSFSFNAEYSHLSNNQKKGVYLRGGLGYIYYGTCALFETGYLIGKKGNYLDLGIGYTIAFEEGDDNMIGIRAGYRRMGPKGLLFRVSPMLAIAKVNNGDTEVWPWAGLSLGYAFRLR